MAPQSLAPSLSWMATVNQTGLPASTPCPHLDLCSLHPAGRVIFSAHLPHLSVASCCFQDGTGPFVMKLRRVNTHCRSSLPIVSSIPFQNTPSQPPQPPTCLLHSRCSNQDCELHFWLHVVKYSTQQTSLMVQWLRLRAPNTGGLSSILDQGTGSHMPKLRVLMLQLKNLNAATKVEDPATKAWCSQINIKEKKKSTAVSMSPTSWTWQLSFPP